MALAFLVFKASIFSARQEKKLRLLTRTKKNVVGVVTKIG